MNNPLELLLRRQKAAQGGRIGFFGGGGADMGDPGRANERADRGYGLGNQNNNKGGGGSHGGKDPQAISAQQMQQAAKDVAAGATNPYGGFNPNSGGGGNQQTQLTPTTEEDKGFFTDLFSNLFTPPTAKEQFVNKVKYNPKLNRFIKETYNVESVEDLTDAQVQAINDYNNLSYDEIKDALSNMTMSAITNPLGATYNAATLGTLGLTGVGMTGLANALANIAMQKPSYAMNPQNFAFTGPMVDEQGNLISQDFSYTGPMTANPAVNQQIANIQNISGVTGLTAAQQAEAVAKAMSSAQTGGTMSFGGDGQNKQLPQTTAQDTVQTYMDSLTESEIDRYNELIEQGYTDEYAKAYLGML